MRIFAPGDDILLWVLYMENGVPVTGLTDIMAEIKDIDGNVLLAQEVLFETSVAGEYARKWNSAGVLLGKQGKIYYRKGTEVLWIDEVQFEDITDEGQII